MDGCTDSTSQQVIQPIRLHEVNETHEPRIDTWRVSNHQRDAIGEFRLRLQDANRSGFVGFGQFLGEQGTGAGSYDIVDNHLYIPVIADILFRNMSIQQRALNGIADAELLILHGKLLSSEFI